MKSKKILVVEDERLVAEDIAECLRMTGYDVCGIANNGQTALDLARTHHPDLVLEDIVIQGDMDGIEVALQLRNELAIPSVFLTAYSQEGILERAKEAEPLGFIIKPFDESSLLSTVKMALHKSIIDTRIRESEEWFSTTLNSIGDGVIATNKEGAIQFMNQLAETLTRWNSSEVEGESIDKVFQVSFEENSEPVPNPALLAMKKNEVQYLPGGCLLHARDGSILPIDDSGAPIHNSGGEVIGSVLVFRDVSDQREAEKQVREYQASLEEKVRLRTEALSNRVELERLNNELASRLLVSDSTEFAREMTKGLGKIARLLGLSGSGVHHLSPDDEDVSIPVAVYSANLEEQASAMAEKTGATKLLWFKSQIMEHRKMILNSIDDLPEEAVAEKEMLLKYQTRALVLLPLNHDGTFVINFSSDEDREWKEHELIGFKSVASVIANALERQRIEADRKLLQDQLNQSQKLEAIGKLTGGIAHDFNNMLVPIIGYADSILEDNGSLAWEEEISEIRKAALSAASLTRQLLAFSRKQILDKKPLRINDEIRNMERMIQRMLGEDIRLIIKAEAENDTMEADRGQIQQILVNLCVNARDAMPDGGSIVISTRNPDSDDSRITVRVEDTGTGMTEEIQEQAFDPFYSTKGMDGTGLGLSVVMGIVHQHQGSVELTSAEGAGTSFAITFPVIRGASLELSDEASAPAAAVQPTDGTGVRILLVEDEPAVMAFVKAALTKKGFDVTAAANKSRAISLFDEEEGQFDMVFTDAKLPDGTGIDVLEHIHQKQPELKALISSGYTDDRALIDQAKKRGVLFLQKPYPLDELFRSLNQVLNEVEPDEILPR